MALIGNSSKDSKYLNRIKAVIEGDHHHPRNNGVRMQAHHIISAEGMKRSQLGKKIEKFGYDINLLPNLVFIPCTLQGACHLNVQLHRGNHTSNQDSYDDDSEPASYHHMVAQRIIDLGLPLHKVCAGDKISNSKKVISELNRLSTTILAMIQNKPNKAPLTRIAKNFSPGSLQGCGSVDSIKKYNDKKACGVDRNHFNREAKEQTSENIKYKKVKSYIFMTGR
ncbi:AHH domain-containing protein [Janthinobacterium sp. FW305-129]|uniref:AHH domain-containing protein n=1 Tax=Janthinobacterium sp. FW305-129 TaxID=2775054 RepID=UPI001E520253|nr:AHH domain-containing protein [Janthinobacterium sp. FW305-129]MCC7596549.1 AHH domain-containing protein [Janthinobacterium sp. FW305-129]